MNDHKDITLMKILLSIDCQVLKTGYNYVEVNYFLCSCDDENINPICAGCADKCHKNHKKTPCPKGKQVCSCGLNNHKLNLEEKSNDKSIMNCIFSELSSGLNKHFFPKNNSGKFECGWALENTCSKRHGLIHFRSIKSVHSCIVSMNAIYEGK